MGVVGTWIVKIIGALIWFGLALVCWKMHSIATEKKDYTQYPTAMGYLRTTNRLEGNDVRQIAEFVDQDGKEVWGMHDYPGLKDFPPLHTTQKICYWKMVNSRFMQNGRPIEYRFRYCDESLYTEKDKNMGKYSKGLLIVGGVFILVGILSLFAV